VAERSARQYERARAAVLGTEGDPTGERRLRLIRRWVTPGQRYFKLLGGAFVMPRPQQRWFQWRLRRAGRKAPVRDLVVLLDEGGWREVLVATWLIAAGRRADLRPWVEQGILGDTPCGDGWSYCTALVCLGTEHDARILAAYLDQALSLPLTPAGTQCQPQAMAALLYLDRQLGADHARRFLVADGTWGSWAGSSDVSLDVLRQAVRDDVVFAAGGNPGLRRRLRTGAVRPVDGGQSAD